ncbi:hypothetical protein B0H14DRAFT_2950597 [Mycena olivaceomarginata]|nr:hypothetical protein B0H14DRAFT_2950597 [Mycena olivaceomarginata]
MLAIVTFILVFAATTPFTNALKRQTLTPTDDSNSPLLFKQQAADGTLARPLHCYDCFISQGRGNADLCTGSRGWCDTWPIAKPGGVPVNGATVSGSSGGSSGTSTTQRGAASGTTSAGSSTSTTTATGSSSGGSSSGSSSGSSGGSSSSSSGNSGSSSGDADSDDGDSGGSSGSGLGSGNGFKSNGGMQLSAGYLVVSVSFAFSAVLLQS